MTIFSEELCHPSPCGLNTKCDVKNGVPTCSCLPGYVGSPFAGCRHECESDYDCAPSQNCRDFKCDTACKPGTCAPTANCDAVNHRPVCTCPKVCVLLFNSKVSSLKLLWNPISKLKIKYVGILEGSRLPQCELRKIT